MPWRVFYSYSHKDADLRERLGTYLAPLRQQKKIVEWYDRNIAPGANWDAEIETKLETSDLILLLVSADFLASDYCFGTEIEKALARLKRGDVKVAPILLKPCLWEESRFSELQMIPRDAKPITQWGSIDAALKDVADEVRRMVAEPPPAPPAADAQPHPPHRFDASLDLVRDQIRSYANLYERTRQRMKASTERTNRMEQVFQKMRAIASASYPLLDELATSSSPGERLAAVAILQIFAAERAIPLLVHLIGSDKPFVGYHAANALRFAVGALEPRAYPALLDAIRDAKTGMQNSKRGMDTDRYTVLQAAEKELKETILAVATPAVRYD